VPAAFLDRSEVESEIRQELAPLPMPLGGWDPAGVRARFGTYRGLVRLLLAEVENRSGNFRRFKQIRWEIVKRDVFVCHGNICRSPYAARRAEAYGLTVASFGLSAGTGESADPSARRIAARRGVDLADHRACDAKDFDFQSGDLLLIMEPRQARAMARRLPTVPCQATLLGLWSRPRRPHIHDPHRLSDAYWEQCFDVIDSAVRTIAGRLRPSSPHER